MTDCSEQVASLLAYADAHGARWCEERAAEELADLAGRRRGPLEAARDVLVARLHRDPGDVTTTNALRLIYRALDRAAFESGALPR